MLTSVLLLNKLPDNIGAEFLCRPPLGCLDESLQLPQNDGCEMRTIYLRATAFAHYIPSSTYKFHYWSAFPVFASANQISMMHPELSS